MDNVKTVSTSTAQPRTEDTSREKEANSQEKEAKIARNSNGEPVGALLYINKSELEALGIVPSKHEQAAYCVSHDEGIDVHPPEREVNMGDE